MNPIINQIMNSVFANNPIMQMFRTISVASNPDKLMENMAQQNPQLQQTLNYIKQNGGNAKQLYYSMCQHKNTDPNIIINQLNQMNVNN